MQEGDVLESHGGGIRCPGAQRGRLHIVMDMSQSRDDHLSTRWTRGHEQEEEEEDGGEEGQGDVGVETAHQILAKLGHRERR